MSSILRALKKLEEEGEVNDARHGWPQGVGPYVRIEKRAGSRRFWFVACALLIAVLLGGFGWLFRGSLPAVQSGKEVAVILPSPAKPVVAHKTETVVTKVTIAAPVSEAPVTPSLPQERNPSPESPAVTVTDDAAPLQEDVAAAVPVALAQDPAAVVARGNDVPLLLPVLDTPELVMQAVAWSENPAQRVAVIGNRVAREGDFVNGYVVVRINQDDVVVRKQGISSRVLFNGR